MDFRIREIIFLIIAIACAGCAKEFNPTSEDFVFVRTMEVVDIDESGATFSAKVADSDISRIQEVGFFWEDVDNPTDANFAALSQDNIEDAFTEGVFQLRVASNITVDKTYAVRAMIQDKMGRVVTGNTVTFKSQGGIAPIIDRISPDRILPGEQFVIYGANFGIEPERVQVYIEGMNATIRRMSNDTLLIKAPLFSFVGPADVTVEKDGKSVTSENGLIVIGPEIKRITPDKIYVGDQVTISGENFDLLGFNTRIVLGNYSTEILERSDTSFVFQLWDLARSFGGPDDLDDSVNDLRIIDGTFDYLLKKDFTINKLFTQIDQLRLFADVTSTSCSCGENGYLLNNGRKDLYRFSSTTQEWEQLTSAPWPSNSFFSVISCDEESVIVYDINDGNGQGREVWSYDLFSKTWSLLISDNYPSSVVAALATPDQTYILRNDGLLQELDRRNARFVDLGMIQSSGILYGRSIDMRYVDNLLAITLNNGRRFSYDPSSGVIARGHDLFPPSPSGFYAIFEHQDEYYCLFPFNLYKSVNGMNNWVRVNWAEPCYEQSNNELILEFENEVFRVNTFNPDPRCLGNTYRFK